MNLQPLKEKVVTNARRRPIWLIVGVIALVLVVWAIVPSSKAIPTTAFHVIKRNDFMISIVEGGTIEAVNEVAVRSEVEGTARIIRIVPEGSYVKKGDLLVELDSSSAQDQVNMQLIAFEKARFALIQAKEQLAIQKSVVDSEVRAAALKVEFAKADLKKLLEGEALQQKRNLEIEVANVNENLLLSKERLEWSEKLQGEGFETKSNLDKDRLAVSQYTLKLEQAQKAQWMFDTFDFPKLKRQGESSVEEAQQALETTKLQGERKLAQFEADVTTQESTVELNKKKLERDQANLAGSKIYAPQDGLVVYAISGNRFSSESLIEEGATIRNRQELIKLPDVSEMKLSIKIHESHINMVRPGQPAYIILDSMPDQRFRGTVRRVGILPDTQSRWGNPNLKVYATEILLVDKLPDVKPGVSARAEVVVTNVQNAITVPLQAITTRQGRQVAYVASGKSTKAVPVEVGLYNTKMIQVVSGLREGDRVLLAPPLDSQEKDLGGAVLNEGEAAAMTNTVMPGVAANSTTQSVARAGRRGEGERRGGPNLDGVAPANPDPAAPGEASQRPTGAGFNREQMTKEFDKNGDGQIDETEREAMRAAMRERFPQQGGGQRRSRDGAAPTEGAPREGGGPREGRTPRVGGPEEGGGREGRTPRTGNPDGSAPRREAPAGE